MILLSILMIEFVQLFLKTIKYELVAQGSASIFLTLRKWMTQLYINNKGVFWKV